MDRQRRLTILRSLLELAHADGRFSDVERDTLAGILSRIGYPAEEVAMGIRRLQSKPMTGELKRQLTNADGRRNFLRDLLTVAFADGVFTAEELDYVEDVAEALEVPRSELERLSQEALAHLSQENRGSL